MTKKYRGMTDVPEDHSVPYVIALQADNGLTNDEALDSRAS